MNYIKRKKSMKVPIGAGIAMGLMSLGGAFLAWGFRGAARRKSKKAGSQGDMDAPTEILPAQESGRLAEKFQSLDSEGKTGHIPRDLERDPKNIEQSIHPR